MIVTRKTFCRFCHVFCGMEVDVDPEGNRIVAVRGDPDNAVTRGYTCMKGRAELERIYHPDRLLASLKRQDGRRVTIDAEQALDEIAEKVRAIVDRHGPRSVAVYAGWVAHRSSAGGPWFLAHWLEALGSPSLCTSFTIDSPSLLVSYMRLFGGVVAVNLFDIHRADVAMFVGTNPVVSHMPTLLQINRSSA